MDTMFLSQHQFTQLNPYMDTLVLTLYDFYPLDPAVPLAASRLIGEQLGARLYNRFRGRSALRPVGASTINCLSSAEHLTIMKVGMPYEVRFGVVLCDRRLLGSLHRIDDEETTWLLFDWWQWIRERVPQSRWSDAWMYLSLACPMYFQSEACLQIGLPEDVRQSMMQEGNKLFDAMEQELAQHLVQLWG